MKIRARKLSSKDRIKYVDTLYTAMAGLHSQEEIRNFLKDLLTEGEKIMIGRRILIAQRLLEDKSYNEIVKELKVGADTIMRIHRWLEDESDGYEKAVKNIQKGFKPKKNYLEKSSPVPYSFDWLRKKYPLHFFLFNLFKNVN